MPEHTVIPLYRPADTLADGDEIVFAWAPDGVQMVGVVREKSEDADGIVHLLVSLDPMVEVLTRPRPRELEVPAFQRPFSPFSPFRDGGEVPVPGPGGSGQDSEDDVVVEESVTCTESVTYSGPDVQAARQVTAGGLRALLADLSDDTPLLVLYDNRDAVSTWITRRTAEQMAVDEDEDGEIGWAQPGTVYLDISEGQ